MLVAFEHEIRDTAPTSEQTLAVVPTVRGRTRYEEAFLASIVADPLMVPAIARDLPTCGLVWNAGASLARALGYGYVCMLADDLAFIDVLTAHAAARGICATGRVPVPYIWTVKEDGVRVFESGGQFGCPLPEGQVCAWSGIPFCRTEDWFDVPPIHYFSDNAFTDAQFAAGRQAVVCPDFAFTHSWAQPGRRHQSTSEPEKLIWEEWRSHLRQPLLSVG